MHQNDPDNASDIQRIGIAIGFDGFRLDNERHRFLQYINILVRLIGVPVTDYGVTTRVLEYSSILVYSGVHVLHTRVTIDSLY